MEGMYRNLVADLVGDTTINIEGMICSLGLGCP